MRVVDKERVVRNAKRKNALRKRGKYIKYSALHGAYIWSFTAK